MGLRLLFVIGCNCKLEGRSLAPLCPFLPLPLKPFNLKDLCCCLLCRLTERSPTQTNRKLAFVVAKTNQEKLPFDIQVFLQVSKPPLGR